jgi:hypothetical protein
MLRSTIQLKKNIEIKKYASLITFIKRKSTGQVSKKFNIFTKQEIEKFNDEGKGDFYVIQKITVLLFKGDVDNRDQWGMPSRGIDFS